jgi:hypothetical protein
MSPESAAMYKSFDVWVYEQEGGVARYRCFENLATGRFCVQSKDFYRLPVSAVVKSQLDLQFFELLLEKRPDVRSGTFDSIEEAIRAHEETFR